MDFKNFPKAISNTNEIYKTANRYNWCSFGIVSNSSFPHGPESSLPPNYAWKNPHPPPKANFLIPHKSTQLSLSRESKNPKKKAKLIAGRLPLFSNWDLKWLKSTKSSLLDHSSRTKLKKKKQKGNLQIDFRFFWLKIEKKLRFGTKRGPNLIF